MAKKRYYDGSMIPSGQGKHANMPTESFMKEFPTQEYVGMRPYGDTFQYTDGENRRDVSKIRSMPAKRRG